MSSQGSPQAHPLKTGRLVTSQIGMYVIVQETLFGP